MIRSFLVNYYMGLEYNGDIDKDATEPYLCKTGKDIDVEYLKIFNKFKAKTSFDDHKLLEAGKYFVKLHERQFKNADKIKGTAKKEYKLKSYSLAVITSWAFAVGVLQKDAIRLKKLYDLPDLSGEDDPLQVSLMANAKHNSDPDNYRGLGTRNDEKERGRLLHLFLGYSTSPKPKITIEMCNAAIHKFHSNQDTINSEKKWKKAFE